MISKLIKKQLEKLQVAKLGPYDAFKKQYIIPKYTPLIFAQDKTFIIKFKPHIINPPSNSILLTNWNNNTHPVSLYAKAYVSKVVGSMIKINSCGYDFENKKDLENAEWAGWIKKDDAEIISAL